MKKRILCIADLHIPYHHRDSFAFLKAIRDEYDINTVCNVGDVIDNHYPSFHEVEPDCLSGTDEIKASRKYMQKLEKIFPDMKISLGNHCTMAKRKARMASIPFEWVREQNTVYGLEGGWDWKTHHYIPYGDNLQFLLIHTVGANTRNNAMRFTHSSVQGHHHSEFCISYEADTERLRWAMTVGCLIDPRSPAFNYDKNRVTKRPILGSGIVIEETPMLIPMILNKSGRWNKRLPI